MDKPKRTIWGERRRILVDWVMGWDWVSIIILLIIVGLLGFAFVLIATFDESEEQREIMEIYQMCMNTKDTHVDCIDWTLEQVD